MGQAQTQTVTPFALNRRVDQLPDGALYWRLQTFPTREAAEVGVGPTGQVGEAEGQVWLFTVGVRGEATEGGTLVDEIGPLEVPSAEHYTLNVNYSSTPPFGLGGGVPASRGVHTHPGTEGWYVLAGEQTVWIPGLMLRTEAGKSQAGPPPGTPLILANTGTKERRAFTLLVLDANQPSASFAVFPGP